MRGAGMKHKFCGPSRPRWAALITAGVLVLAACDGILDVDESGIIIGEDLDEAGPAAIPALVNGIVGSYQEAADDIVRYTSLMTDEMIAAGTFPTRLQVDGRRIQQNNTSITGGMYIPLHQARQQADTTVFVLQKKLQEPEFTSVIRDVSEGIALGKLYGGYSRVWLAEIYCWSILTGVFPETSPLLPDTRMLQALTFLREAESLAGTEGLEDVRQAAIVGQARAHLWLRDFDQAAALAAGVPREFTYLAEYSHNSPGQFNELYSFTWGNTQGIDWTVGNGESPTRGNEKWEFLDQFVRLNLLHVSPDGFRSSDSNIPVVLQRLYPREESSVLMASGLETALIRAEAAVRSGQTATAAQLLNDLRSDYSLRVLLRSRVELPLAGDHLVPLVLTGDLLTDLKTVAGERARELWLTGDRLTTSRRFRAELGIDLFPSVKETIGGGDDIAFPIPQLELDTNPNLGTDMACPAGQTIGAWR